MKPLSAFATASLATAALYAREDVVTTNVTTLPDTTGVTTIPGTIIETTITRTLATVTVSSTETDGTIESYTVKYQFELAEFTIGVKVKLEVRVMNSLKQLQNSQLRRNSL